jgi:hypothetical protein
MPSFKKENSFEYIIGFDKINLTFSLTFLNFNLVEKFMINLKLEISATESYPFLDIFIFPYPTNEFHFR